MSTRFVDGSSAGSVRNVKIPESRGAASAVVFERLCAAQPGEEPTTTDMVSAVRAALAECHDVIVDEDLQVLLFCLYELHYSGVENVDDLWEWDPGILHVRSIIEAAFETRLRSVATVPERPPATAAAVSAALFQLTGRNPAPTIARFVARHANDDQLRELLMQRSISTLREADPHSWAIPRLNGAPKAALVEVQFDEYGSGRPGRMRSELFARSMRGLGLDDSYGAYVNEVSAVVLASVNMMSLFGLHRRLRGAIIGHLAAFEMTSSVPNRFLGNGFRRRGYDPDVTWYFDEHGEADAVHEQVAGRDLAGGLAEQDPSLVSDIMFGAAACLEMDRLIADHLLTAWKAHETSLRSPLPSSV